MKTEIKVGCPKCLNMVSSDSSSYQTIIRSANSPKSFNKWLQRSTVPLCPSDVGAPSHSGTVTIGWLFSLPAILFSSTATPTKALGMMETPTYLTEIHMLLQIVGEITSLTKSWKSLVNYGGIITSQEILAGLQYSPTGLILRQSTFKVPLILIPEVSWKGTQNMKQSHIVASAMNLLSPMNMVTTLLGILMMVTPQINHSETSFGFGYYSQTIYEQYPHPAVSRQDTIHPTVSIIVQFSRKAGGTNHYSWTVTVTVHQTVPRQNHSDYYCFRWKRNSPSIKAIYSPWFQQSPEESKASSSL